jgi:hypothetical protein
VHKNVFWRAFLLVVTLTTLIYSGIATYRYHAYLSLSAKQPLTGPISWDVEEKSSEDFILISNYTYQVNGLSYSGETKWSDTPYRNGWAAQQAIEVSAKESFTVWYDPSDPSYSSLQKHFPLKECVYAVFLWGLLLYFVWLGYYAGSYRGQ